MIRVLKSKLSLVRGEGCTVELCEQKSWHVRIKKDLKIKRVPVTKSVRRTALNVYKNITRGS